MDLLYSPIHLSAIPQPRWSFLGPIWYSTFQQWYRLLQGPSNTTTHTTDALKAPIWRQYQRVFGPKERPMEHASIHIRLLYQHGYQHPSDFIGRFGSLPFHKFIKQSFPLQLFSDKGITWPPSTFKHSSEASLQYIVHSSLSISLQHFINGLLKTRLFLALATEDSIACCTNFRK